MQCKHRRNSFTWLYLYPPNSAHLDKVKSSLPASELLPLDYSMERNSNAGNTENCWKNDNNFHRMISPNKIVVVLSSFPYKNYISMQASHNV